MRFKTVKHGYDSAEVEEYIKRLREVYDKTLIAQRDRIFEQRDLLENAEAKIAEYEKNSGMISSSIESATQKAEDIKQSAQAKYAEEVASLREFHEVWVKYFAHIKQKYPMDQDMPKLSEMNEKIDSVLNQADEFVPREGRGFDPVGMIETLLASSEVEEQGGGALFSYDEAQNPDGKLEDILGELGITVDD